MHVVMIQTLACKC